ncbi:uncharacterized protein NPIL_207271 [Nephila pilipes]|uniref:Uncharacterized protein n=1 Tax=Nephila pilipes TaxID=299642 RepID=A0A8X6U6P0_NEPPI|nr:uncharacterized protein NPIL_207271 [Nephila pilipes]
MKSFDRTIFQNDRYEVQLPGKKDGDLPFDIQEEWLLWCTELPRLSDLKISRIIPNSIKEEITDVVEIHSFCVANQKTYGIATYLRVLKRSGIEVNLITSKSRVTSLK